jgi:hypothetical protein
MNTSATGQPGLNNLSDVPLGAHYGPLVQQALVSLGGPPDWRHRKPIELHDLAAMAELAPRLVISQLDAREAIRALIRMQVPVATRKHAAAPLEIKQEAVLGLTIREESMRTPQPGYSFFEVLTPADCWHANISRDAVQALCLGATLPAGIRARELVLMAYGALSMQSVMVDQYDPAGVLNAEAALWWQLNMDKTPLSTEPFLIRSTNDQ